VKRRALADDSYGIDVIADGSADRPRFRGEATFRDGLLFSALWERRSGRWEPYQFTIHERTTKRPLSASRVRQLPMGELLWEMRLKIDADARQALDSTNPAVRKDVAEQYLIQGSQRGRALTGDDLTAVAVAYRDAWEQGIPVTQAVSAACHLSRSGATKRIMAARKAGLLDGVGPKS
jgi:hypothetical protein